MREYETPMSTPASRVQPRRGPVRFSDEYVGLNGRIAAALTKRVGSMWTFYATVAIVLLWIALAAIGVQRFDPYPFAFLLFIGNIVQMTLCFLIMIGHRVQVHATDRQMTQIDENAEAIFHQLSRLQEHMERQDMLINRGVSLLQWRPNSWIEQQRVRDPQRSARAPGINGRIAARITEVMGSMWPVYIVTGIQFLWFMLATWGPLRPIDPYPFAFLLFLTSLAQLFVLVMVMVTVMVD